MIFAYIRVSTNMQTVENQIHEIESRGFKVDKYFKDEGISGAVDWKKRQIYNCVKHAKKGDTIVCADLSRLGRTLLGVMEAMSVILNKGINLVTIKENFRLDNSINSKVISFAFGLTNEIERSLCSQRVKEALALRKAQGKTLGRPVGSKNKTFILDKYKDYILKKKEEGRTNNWIKNKLHCHYNTLRHALEMWC